MQQLREEHDEVLNSDKGNGATETIEEFDKLRQILEEQTGDAMNIGEERDVLRRKVKALQWGFNEERSKSYKGSKTIQLVQKYLKLDKSARKQQTIQLAYTQIVLK